MTIPSTNIQLANDVYAEANGGYTSGPVELFNLGFQSYFNGPNGANTIGYNAWGRGVGSGADRIYGTTATSTNMNLNGFAGLTYFYDNSTFQVTLAATNNLSPPAPPPPPQPAPPPGANDVNVNIELWDSSFAYQYISGGGSAAENGGTFGPNSISQATGDPIIFRGYWKVSVSGMPPFFTGGSCDISINGTSKVTGGTVVTTPGGSTFDSGTYGTQDVATYLSLTGLYFEVTVY